MNEIDKSLQQARSKNRWLVIIATILGVAIVSGYLVWLFLIRGFQITVYPEEIRQQAGLRVVSGLAKSSGTQVYTLGGNAEIEVFADRYESKIISIDSLSDANISVELQPKPAQVSFKTSPILSDLEWYLDGQLVGQSTSLELSLVPGSYDVEVKHPFFKPKQYAFDVSAADEVNETWVMEGIKGSISISTVPGAAELTYGHSPTEVKFTPDISYDFDGGEYSIRVSKEGYEPIKDKIRITYQQPNVSRDYKLLPLSGKLSVDVTPQNSSVLLDGKPFVNSSNVEADRKHSLKVIAPGFQNYQTEVTLKPGENRQLAVKLKKEYAEVEVRSNINGQVYIDGMFKGETPQTLNLQTVPQKIEVRKEGFRAVTKLVTPSFGSTKVVDVELLTEFAARRKEGKPLFISTLGIDMIRVQGKSFVMGSPDNETNRYRNEFRKNVGFSKSILMSKHEITEAQYSAFDKNIVSSALPVSNVSWEQAALYTNWLSDKEGLTPFYSIHNGQVVGVNKQANGYRLPTEAEWEFVAKAYKRSALTAYVWGNQARLRKKQGNFADMSLKGKQTFYFANYDDGFAGKAPVGSFKSDRSGFHDLDGNVREWVHDFYSISPPTDTSVVDPLGPEIGDGHVVKGASFKIGRLKNVRASRRVGESISMDDIGFRIARYY